MKGIHLTYLLYLYIQRDHNTGKAFEFTGKRQNDHVVANTWFHKH